MLASNFLRMAQLVFWLCSASLVYAAEPALSPEAIPLTKWSFATLLSFWGGLASALQRWARASEVGKWPLLIARDLVCSISLGMIFFLLATHWSIAPYVAAIAVFVGGYGGSRGMELLYTALEARAVKEISGKELEK